MDFAGSATGGPLDEEPRRLQQAQLAARLAVIPAVAILTLQVANARPSRLELDAAKKAGTKDAKAAAAAVKAAKSNAAIAASLDALTKKERTATCLSFLEVSAFEDITYRVCSVIFTLSMSVI